MMKNKRGEVGARHVAEVFTVCFSLDGSIIELEVKTGYHCVALLREPPLSSRLHEVAQGQRHFR